MKISLPTAISTRIAKQALLAQKNSPRLLFVGGIALMGATVVTSARATLQLGDVLACIVDDREAVADAQVRNPDKYSDRDIQKLNMYITLKGAANIAKLYLPSIALGVAAVACLTSSHNQLSRRNAGLSAALAATERALDNYRGRIRENLGEDKELELWRGVQTEEKVVLDDEGRETKSKTKVKVGGGYSPYARIWGRDTSNEWDPRSEYNLAKLRSVQNLCTMRLNHRGHLFLNEVFDELGLDRTAAGAVVGWKSLANGGADGFVDLGVLGTNPQEELTYLDFATGREDHLLLDFNVDGEIWREI